MKKIFFVGSGIGRTKRGFEAHIEDLFYRINSLNQYEVFLLKGAGLPLKNETVIANLSSKSSLSKILFFLIGKDPYYLQNITFFLGLIPHLIKNKVDTIYLGEPVLCNLLIKWRKMSKQKFKIIFFTGGQTMPSRVEENDIIQHVSPLCIEKAMKMGISEKSQFLIPHFLNLTEHSYLPDSIKIKRFKEELDIPENHTVVLSVGSIDHSVKRMDFIIHEVSRLEKNVFLILLGEEGNETSEIKKQAKELLKKNYIIKTVDRKELYKYYSIADIFVLASLKEGFGIVYIEALSYGVPVIAHDYPIARYVLKDYGHFIDLSRKGSLIKAISVVIKNEFTKEEKNNRRLFVYRNYSWDTLRELYISLFD